MYQLEQRLKVTTLSAQARDEVEAEQRALQTIELVKYQELFEATQRDIVDQKFQMIAQGVDWLAGQHEILAGQVDDLDQETALIRENAARKQALIQERADLSKLSPKHGAFINGLEASLSASLMTAVMLSTGLIEHAATKRSLLAGAAGLLIDQIPFVGGVLSFLTQEGAGMLIGRRQDKQVAAVVDTAAPTRKDAELFARYVALEVTSLMAEVLKHPRITIEQAEKAGNNAAVAVYNALKKGKAAIAQGMESRKAAGHVAQIIQESIMTSFPGIDVPRAALRVPSAVPKQVAPPINSKAQSHQVVQLSAGQQGLAEQVELLRTQNEILRQQNQTLVTRVDALEATVVGLQLPNVPEPVSQHTERVQTKQQAYTGLQ